MGWTHRASSAARRFGTLRSHLGHSEASFRAPCPTPSHNGVRNFGAPPIPRLMESGMSYEEAAIVVRVIEQGRKGEGACMRQL